MVGSGETGKKERIRYCVRFVRDGDMETDKCFSIRMEVFKAFLAAVVFLIIAALSYCFILAGDLRRSNDNKHVLAAQAKALMEQNEALLAENDGLAKEIEELQETVDILSDTINGKVQQEQEREAEIAQTYIPTGFPLKGTASYNESETELEGNPIAVFHAPQGTSVVATANGTVYAIAGDVRVGYIVMIDHGNGYYTVYRNGAAPKVEEGDTVTNMTEIYNIESGNDALGYQIIENEKYIDPLSLMETYG